MQFAAFQRVLDAIATMQLFQCSIVVVLKSCRLRLKMANASATLATRFLPLPFLHAFAHGPACCKSREHNILMSLALALDVRTVKATKTLTHPELLMFVTHALGFGDIEHWGVQQTTV